MIPIHDVLFMALSFPGFENLASSLLPRPAVRVQRRAQLEPVSRQGLLEHCPAIFKALADVLSTTAAAAAAVAATTGAASATDVKDATEKGTAPKTATKTTASSTMLKAKRLKPLLGCLSATIKADEGVGSLSGLKTEARAIRAALEKVGEASASLPMQLLCGDVASELDVVDEGPTGDSGVDENGVEHRKKKKKREDKASPKPKRKATSVDSPAVSGSGAADGGDEGEGKGKKTSSKKKRRDSKG